MVAGLLLTIKYAGSEHPEYFHEIGFNYFSQNDMEARLCFNSFLQNAIELKLKQES